MHTNRVLILTLALFLIFGGLAFAGGNQEAETENQNDDSQTETSAGEEESTPIESGSAGNAVALVNGIPIERSRFETTVAQTQAQAAQQGQQIGPDQVLERMIEEELLYQKSIQEDVEVSEDQIESQIERTRSNFANQEEFENALSQAGLTEDGLREQIRRSLAINGLITQEIGQNFQISEEESRAFYDENPQFFEQGEQVEARHILVSTEGVEGEDAMAEARDRAEDLKAQLDDGADFETLAQEESDGPSASRGGNLGTFGRGQMVPSFEEVAFTLEVGEISEVVETQFGFHIIQVTNKTESGTTPYAQAKPQIDQYLTQQKRSEAIQEYLDGLKEDADIQRNLEQG